MLPLVFPKSFKDQHFCIDKSVLAALLEATELSSKDTVVEIGSGTGLLTKELVQHAKKIIAIELDHSLKPILLNNLSNFSSSGNFSPIHDFPSNIELIFGNALEILPKRKDFNKIISNLPYQICEPVLQYLTTAKHVEKAAFTVPLAFARRAQKHSIFSAFFEITIVKKVPKEAFFPQPKVISAVITIIPISNPTDTQFFIQKLHLQRNKKLKNGLRDALIDLYRRKQKILTKKQALELIVQFHLSPRKLDTLIAKITLNTWRTISRNL